MDFEWDDAKELANRRKHGESREGAGEVGGANASDFAACHQGDQPAVEGTYLPADTSIPQRDKA
jgi:hypothetical protein